jgi:hypothetical protein
MHLLEPLMLDAVDKAIEDLRRSPEPAIPEHRHDGVVGTPQSREFGLGGAQGDDTGANGGLGACRDEQTRRSDE